MLTIPGKQQQQTKSSFNRLRKIFSMMG